MQVELAVAPSGPISGAPRRTPSIDLGPLIEDAVKSAPNNAFIQSELDKLSGNARLVRFLHRFLLFNDALAARVPFLAGLIHLTPDLFLDADDAGRFCAQRNAGIAAHVAEAASDEYRMTPSRNMVHQHLSQVFFRAVLAHFGMEQARFDAENPVPDAVNALLAEARGLFFENRSPENVFAALGFHVGLEFFANEEFNDVDQFLNRRHEDLAAALKIEGPNGAPYVWLALHCVVEVGHYSAGLEAVRGAVEYCSPRRDAARMAEQIMRGLDVFADLQLRFYQLVLAEGA